MRTMGWRVVCGLLVVLLVSPCIATSLESESSASDVEPPVCNYANQQIQSNFSLCGGDISASWCANNLPASQIVPFDDPVFPCSSPMAHCVAPPPSSANAGDPLCYRNHGCTFSHTIPFELMSFSPLVANMTPPMQYLGVYTSAGFSITDMLSESTAYNDPVAPFVWIPQVHSSVVSPTNFLNTAFLVFGYEDALRVYNTSLYDSLTVSSCTVAVPEVFPIYKVDTVFDSRSNATWILVYSQSKEVHFIPINSTGCPDTRLTQKWTLSSPDGSVNFTTQFNVSFVSQITPDHSADVQNGCFPPLASRTLVSINTQYQVFIFGFAPSTPLITNNTFSVTLVSNSVNKVYDVRSMSNNASIFFAQVFGECFGNIDAPSQMLWLAVSIQQKSGNSSLQLISLNEFSLHPLSCDLTDSSWWLHPSSYRTGCVLITNLCAGYNMYALSATSCLPRTVRTTLLNSTAQAPINIFHRMQTSSYDSDNSVTPSSERFVHLLFLYSPSNFTLSIYGMQEEACASTNSSSMVVLEQLNSFSMAHAAQHIDITDNGQHVFVSFIMGEWEIEAHQRLLNICAILMTNSSLDSVLLKYNSTCNDLSPEPLSAFSYLEYYSQCSGGERCWRYGNYENTSREDLGNTIIQYPEPSYFALRPTVEFECDEGFYCPGDSSRVECPSGYYCPGEGLETPTKCMPNPHYDTTCRYTGLASPVPCPDGMVCLSPSSAPVPAPPGFYVAQYDRDVLWTCDNGTWCALQQFNISNEGIMNDMECLSGASCASPAILAPVPCQVGNNTEYCPMGTVVPSPCPAGNFCSTPQTMAPCLQTYYCPEGSQQAQLCPEGFYCPSPSEKYTCPENYYCRTGFIAPQKCHPLVYCPKGSQSEKFAWSGLIFDLGVILFLMISFWIWIRIRNWLFRNRKPRPVGAKKQKVLQLRPKKFRVEFGFQDLTLELTSEGKTKKILDGVTGSIKPGRVTAVMGPSGAGKSTFLTTLAGKNTTGTLSGSLTMNGSNDDIVRYKKIVGFVPQEDIMHRELTVKENIMFNAAVRLPTNMSKDGKKSMVNDVIEILDLYDVRHERIGDESTRGVSGGQRKRVNIAMELVADPTVLFLDEPTSGLDSTSSEKVVRCLKRVAELGLTIVVVLHQPRYEIFQLFDDVLLLAKGGRTVYLGPSVKALEYFHDVGFTCPQLTNPPDFFMDVISGSVRCPARPDLVEEKQISDYLCRSWTDITTPSTRTIPNNHYIDDEEEEEDENTTLLPAVARRRTAGFFEQLKLFFVRALVQLSRDLTGFMLDNALVLVAGSVLGALYVSAPYRGPLAPQLIQMCPAFMQDKCELPQQDQLNAMAMLISLSTGFTAITASLKCFGPEKVVFWREASTGINKNAYFIGKNLAQLFNIGLAPVVFLSVFYALTSPRATFLTYYTILVLLQFCFAGFGYLVSVMLDYKNAQLAGVVLTLIFGMFGGTNPSLKQLHENIVTTVVSSLSPNRWAQEALYVSEITRYEGIYSIDSSLEFWGFNKNNYHLDLYMLLALGFASRIIALILLRNLRKDKMQ